MLYVFVPFLLSLAANSLLLSCNLSHDVICLETRVGCQALRNCYASGWVESVLPKLIYPRRTPESKEYTTINTHQGLYQHKRLTLRSHRCRIHFSTHNLKRVERPSRLLCLYWRHNDLWGNRWNPPGESSSCVTAITGMWTQVEPQQVPFHATPSCLPGHDYFSWESKNHQRGRRTHQCTGTAVLPGSVNFLRKFVPDFARIASSLYQLLCKEIPCKWGKLEQEALNNRKATLCPDSLLRRYDPASTLILQCDASPLLQSGPNDS